MACDEKRQKAKAMGLSDQCWAGSRTFQPDIERIANGGPRMDDMLDQDIVRMVFSAVAGDLHLRAAEGIEP